ncbi:zinc-binding alcohol dehydrogenase family protein [Peteryoungia desertarenae]|uniref:Zinc-binding alcohol dehydrogenase family protein n=1 Tax=Peteryoungia desertarenae TaxID=1813451 RepID=A0ABX6QJL8_9HYPH|nr:zinc-binding alcohol dehydrogenase family protein [Peteryoungia desertarenae]QLF68744.1 zinc-binding alcohol dehydrogenase family protein [Peteryoungia desertarenae]
MKAAICIEPGRLELVDRPQHKQLEPGEVRLSVSHVGICGTDYHIFQGKHPFMTYPRIMGHEISARVMEGGTGVFAEKGTLAIVNPYISCGHCIACRKGKPNCCMRIEVLGVHRDGAFCEEIVVPQSNLYLADGLTAEAAATVEFLAIGAHAVRRGINTNDAERALVIGAGPIGLGTALFARIAGLDVTLLDTSAERLSVADQRFGFSRSILGTSSVASDIADQTSGEGYDIVFDATGNAASMESAFGFVAHGGSLIFVSVVKDQIRFSDPEFHKREMCVVGSRNATHADFDYVRAALAAGMVPSNLLITHRTTLDRLPQDLPRWALEKTGLIKAVVAIGEA